MPRPTEPRLFAGKPSSCINQKPRSQCAAALLIRSRPKTHYETLGVPESASAIEIHAAYKRQALATHPDKGGAVADFQQVLAAFQTLSDATQRQLYDEQQSIRPSGRRKPLCRRRAPSNAHMFYQKLSQLLRRMSSVCRRDTILYVLTTSQRVALEKHIREEKEKASKSLTVESCQSETRSGTGIYRASRIGGYYAKVFVCSLGLQGHARLELEDVVNDHVALTKVADQLKRQYFLPDDTNRRCPEQLQDELPPGLVASVQVFFYNRHFIGHHHLQLNFKSLPEGLEAWDAMQTAKGPTLFIGNGVTDAYSPEAAMQQWLRVKEAYLRYASAMGRRSSKSQLEEQLSLWEKEQLQNRLQRECKLRQRQRQQSDKACQRLGNKESDPALAQCVEQLLKCEGKFLRTPLLEHRHPSIRKRALKELVH